MRKTRQEITDAAVLKEILGSAVICRLAMSDGEIPYLLPFNYGYREGCIYIHSAPDGKKIDLLEEHPKVCFEVEDTVRILRDEQACKWTTLYRSVVGYGEVEIVRDEAGKQHGLEVIMAQHGAPELVDFEPGHMKNMVVLKLTIDTMTGKQSSNWNRYMGE